ncbi:IMv membrane protein [Cetacean poxvirus 1]|nr:IMv membrane protein [Cetacean poxvirus 1]
MNEDINESNLAHLLIYLSENCQDKEFIAIICMVREILNIINNKILIINKKSKKNSKVNGDINYAAGRKKDNN